MITTKNKRTFLPSREVVAAVGTYAFNVRPVILSISSVKTMPDPDCSMSMAENDMDESSLEEYMRD